MTCARIAGAALLVLLGAGLLIRITNRAGVPPKKPDRAPVEIGTIENQAVTETVDPKTGNIHLEIPIRAATTRATDRLSRRLLRHPCRTTDRPVQAFSLTLWQAEYLPRPKLLGRAPRPSTSKWKGSWWSP